MYIKYFFEIYFIFLLFLKIISSQSQEDENSSDEFECRLGQPAKNSTDCLKKNKNGTFCCFLFPLNEESNELNSFCYPYSINDYKGGNQISYKKKKYNIDCGLGSTFMNRNWNLTLSDRYMCSTENPEKSEDCFKGSNSSNSCCYYEGYGLKSCYWLGIKYKGSTNKKGYFFECKANFLKVKKILLKSLLIFLLFI